MAAAVVVSTAAPAWAARQLLSSGVDGGLEIAGSLVTSAGTLSFDHRRAVARPSKSRPTPRAVATAPPPAIVKILRRGGPGRDARGCGWRQSFVDNSSMWTGFGPRAAQAALVANAADIVRLCRWLL